ncbi:hypothetical protein PR202_gb06902 [Eleusine coracana subsp. coracana]|uniref:Protein DETOXIFICATION n=1 Tax=Eleusine coracana subsp. coracana TaxID=191504 RepID=A0AAV5EA33_ELECO|nr:hypothetical protein PR202_gb06902 [Eleusine coracana subsp. coracana]
MEAPLLTGKKHGVVGEEDTSACSEVRKQLYLAGPLVAAHLLMNSVQVVSLMFVGRLGRLEFAGASVATAFTTATGLCLLGGMASALATLCGQAFGAGQYRQVGVHKQRAMLVLAAASVPVAALWAYAGELLAWCGVDTDIAASAGSYARWLTPSLFAFAQMQCHIQFLQAQNVVVPVMAGAAAAAACHPVVCWLLARGLGLGSRGVALSIAVADLVNLAVLAVYVRVAPSCKATTWTGFSGEAFHGIPGFLKLAVPSALMVCMEWWSFQLLVLLAGLLPNPKLETAVVSISLHTVNLAVMVSIGLGSAISTRVSNELGASRPAAAGLATRVVLFLAISVCVSEGLAMVLARNLLGYVYSNDEEVAKYAARVMPVLAVALLFDGLQNVLSGKQDTSTL